MRWSMHRFCFSRNEHHNRHLQNAWNQYGEDAFSFSVLEYCEIAALISTEQKWLDQLHACDPKIGFNKKAVADSALGVKHSAETRRKASEAAKKRYQNNPVMQERMAAARRGKPSVFLGRHHTEENKEKARIRAKAWITDEFREQMSQQNSCKESPFLGKTHRPEVLALLKGRRRTPEHQQKLADGRRGKTLVLIEQKRAEILSLRAAGLSYPKIRAIVGLCGQTCSKIVRGTR
jgi:group I intron endonuclease